MLWITRLTLRFPVATLALAIGLAVVSLVYTQQKLGYRTSRVDLVNPDNDYNRLWIEYANEFGDEDDAVVVVEGANRDQVVPVLQEISNLLAREDQLFHAVLHGVNLEKIRPRGCTTCRRKSCWASSTSWTKWDRSSKGNWARLNLGHMAGGMCQHLEYAAGKPPAPEILATQQELERLSESLLARTQPAQAIPFSLARDAAIVRHAQRTERRIPAHQRRPAGLRAVAIGAPARTASPAAPKPSMPCGR